jgi:hypothetical protein
LFPFSFILLSFARELKPSTHHNHTCLRNALRIHGNPYTIQALLCQRLLSPKRFKIDLSLEAHSKEAAKDVKQEEMQITMKQRFGINLITL